VAFNQLIEELEVVALRSTAPILLTGPTGAGKSQLARRVFELRESRTLIEGDFVEINCATLDEQAMLLRALEEGTFLPMGSDVPVKSRFQLIAGTNRDLRMAEEFREDLFARINTWTFELPGLKNRREDIAPNLDYELERFAEREGNAVTFNKEAKERFLAFAEAPSTEWRGNFRDLNAAMVRMGTLAPSGRIRVEEVEKEVKRLETSWVRNE